MMKTVRMMMGAMVLGVCLLGASLLGAEASGKVKVFILAGQSNMEGKARNTLLDHQAAAPETKDLFKHLRKDGKWIVRDDVFIKYLKRKGGLTIGYGSRGCTGVELEFGTVMGDFYDEPVVLIKAAWGGHSLFKLFRPPSAGMPSDASLQADLEKAQKRVKQNNEKRKRNDPLPTMDDIKKPYGLSYRNMMSEVKDVFENYETMFPALKGKQLELAGFVWFQGFNDMWGTAPAEYASNMKHFISDVRKDLKAPKLPFVIGALGQNGSKPAKGGMLEVRNAQLAMNAVPEFKGNVTAIRTDVLADKNAERLIDGWQNHVEEWKKVGSDRPYHYLGSAIWFNRIGKAFGQVMVELRGGPKAPASLTSPPAGKVDAAAGFTDRFDGKLGAGWRWLREDKKTWRIQDGGLEIRVQPGAKNNVRNALVRKAPDREKGPFAIDVTITNHTLPTVQYEQAGITLYHNGKPGMKLVKELINGKLYIIPGRKPMAAKTVQLRLVVSGTKWTARYRPDGKGEFLTAATGRLPAPGKDEISIQCYNGPPDADHWIRFDDFGITAIEK